MSNPIFHSPKVEIELREVQEADLDLFFAFQQDPAAVHMAAFVSRDPTDRAVFDAHWQRILADEQTTNRTILFEGQVVGHVASFVMFGDLEVTYWIDRAYWGKGLATQALSAFLTTVQKKRPIYGRAAKDNLGSRRVLEKCGFQYVGEDKGFANARGKEIVEVIMRREM
ncbi:MAG: GNAT family N-acetyltransferase [Candidatus Promineifilaceae bacterium]